MQYFCFDLQNKPRISPWDGTFKSHRLCKPKSPWYSELVPINDIVPAEFLEGQGEFMIFMQFFIYPQNGQEQLVFDIQFTLRRKKGTLFTRTQIPPDKLRRGHMMQYR